MNLKTKLLLPAMLILFATFSACNRDGETGNATFEITDAPIDDANVEAVFVTVADLKVDGESVEGFSKQTIELSAYQNGKTETLYNGEIAAQSYSEVTLVLDYAEDESGNTPGTYVVTDGGTKKELSNSTSGEGEFTSNMNLNLTAEGDEDMVIDFDLRKAIQYDENDQNNYSLIASSESSAAVRTVNKNSSSTVSGSAEDNSTTGIDGTVVAYLYKKGEYNQSTETSGNVMFKGAVTSTKIDGNGNYTLAFVEEGEYELHLANYNDEDKDGKSEFKGMVDVSFDFIGGNNLISVESNVDLNVNISLVGLL